MSQGSLGLSLACGALVTTLALGTAFPRTVEAARAEDRSLAAGSWERDKKDPRWVHGRVDVATAPSAVWDRARDVPSWPKLFSDIRWLTVKAHDGSRWRVRLETRSMNCGSHEYDVVLEPAQRRVRLDIDAPGIDSRAWLIVRDGAPPAKADIRYSLYVRATGVMGWFISEKTLRAKQEQMVQRNLDDLRKAFGASSAS